MSQLQLRLMRHAVQLQLRPLQAHFGPAIGGPDRFLISMRLSCSKRADRPASDVRLLCRLDGKAIAFEELEFQLLGLRIVGPTGPPLCGSGRGPLTVQTTILQVRRGLRQEFASTQHLTLL